jgi:hypothetical protein
METAVQYFYWTLPRVISDSWLEWRLLGRSLKFLC